MIAERALLRVIRSRGAWLPPERVPPPDFWEQLSPDERAAINVLTRRIAAGHRPKMAIVRAVRRHQQHLVLVGSNMLALCQWVG